MDCYQSQYISYGQLKENDFDKSCSEENQIGLVHAIYFLQGDKYLYLKFLPHIGKIEAAR